MKKIIFLLVLTVQNYLLLANQTPASICPDIISKTHAGGSAEGMDFGSYDGKYFWIANFYDGTLFKIDNNGTPVNIYKDISLTAQAVASDGTYVWIGDTDQNGTLQKFSIKEGKVIANYHFNFHGNVPYYFSGFNHIIWDGSYLWLAPLIPGYSGPSYVYKFNTTTDSIALTVTVGASVNLLSYTTYNGKEIILGARANDFMEIDADTGATTMFASKDPWDYHAVASDGIYVYEADFKANSISKYALSNGAFITSWPTDRQPNEILWDGHYIWTSNISSEPNAEIYTTSGTKICHLNNAAATDIVKGNKSIWGVVDYDIYQIGLLKFP